MKANILLVIGSFFGFVATAQKQVTPAEAQAAALVKKMTLEEKVGQMTQVTLAVFAKGAWANEDGELDPVALKKTIVDYKVGSILNTTAHALPVEKWRSMITQIQDEVKKPVEDTGALRTGCDPWADLYPELNFISAKPGNSSCP